MRKGNVGQCEATFQILADKRKGQVLIRPVFADLPHGHRFDQRQFHALPMGEFHQCRDFMLVEILEGDGVELDRDACLLRSANALHHAVEVAPAGDGLEFGGVECCPVTR